MKKYLKIIPVLAVSLILSFSLSAQKFGYIDSNGLLAEMPEVKEKIDTYMKDQEKFKAALLKHSKQESNVVITDQRGVDKFPVGNRFLIYTLFPETNVSARIFKGREDGVTVCAVGHSIFNRTCKTIVGALMSEFGGGGHKGAGTCQFPDAEADEGIRKVVDRLIDGLDFAAKDFRCDQPCRIVFAAVDSQPGCQSFEPGLQIIGVVPQTPLGNHRGYVGIDARH